MSARKSQKEDRKKISSAGGAEKKSTKKETKKITTLNSPKSEEKKTSPPPEKQNGYSSEAAENIDSGAEVVEEGISQVAKKTAEVAGNVFDTIKKGFSRAYKLGTEVVDEITQTAHEYTEKYKHNMEVKKLTDERDKLIAQLGLTTFVKYKMKESTPQKLLEEKEILDLIRETEKLDRKIVKIGKKLEKGK